MCVVSNSRNTDYFVKSQNQQELEFLLIDTNFRNSFAIVYKKISECFKVFVECIICFGDLKEASSSLLQSTLLTLETSPNTK